jgi:hypothetical protein
MSVEEAHSARRRRLAHRGRPAPLDKGHQRDRPAWRVTMASDSGQKETCCPLPDEPAAQFLCEVTDTSISHPGLVMGCSRPSLACIGNKGSFHSIGGRDAQDLVWAGVAFAPLFISICLKGA